MVSERDIQDSAEQQSASGGWQVVGEKDAAAAQAKADQEFTRETSLPAQPSQTPTFGKDIISPMAKQPTAVPAVPVPTHPTAPYGDQAFDHVAVVPGPDGTPHIAAKDNSPQAQSILQTYLDVTAPQVEGPHGKGEKSDEQVSDEMAADLASANKVLVQPFEKAAQFGSDIGRDVGASVVAQATGKLPPMIAGEGGFPLVPQEMPDPAAVKAAIAKTREEHPVAAGVASAVGSVAGGMAADPRNYPFFFGSLGSAVMRRVISAGFSAQMAKSAVDSSAELARIYKDPIVPKDKKVELGTSAVLSALMAADAGAHAIGGEHKPALQPDILPPKRRSAGGLEPKPGPPIINATRGALPVGESGKAQPQEAEGRPAVQASDNPDEIRKSAAKQEPKLEQMAEAAAAPVPGAQVEGSRVKTADSQENKDDRGKPPESNIDNLGARVSAPDDASRAQVEQVVESKLPVVSKDKIDSNGLDVTQYGIKTGKPGEANQVSELQVADKATMDAMKETEPLYEKQKAALARGDQAEADRIGKEIAAKHQELTQSAGGYTVVQEHDKEPEYKHGSTQADIPKDSQAAKVISALRDQIPEEHLAGKGKDIDEAHVTVRYGLDGDEDKVRSFLEKQAPFEATLGRTAKFEPSESSDGAAVIMAPIDAPELHRINGEIEKHGQFAASNFPEYKPHATIAYVKPEVADKYVGLGATEGKKFTVDQIAITDRHGKKDVVKLGGAGRNQAPTSQPASAPQGKPKAESTPSESAAGKQTQRPQAESTPKPQTQYDQAVAAVKEHGKASATLLQRKLRIGYGEAARLIDRMISEGITNGRGDVLAKPEAANEKPATPVQPVAAQPKGQEASAQPAEGNKAPNRNDGESEIEAARRGAAGEPPEEKAVNHVPEDQRASTLIAKDQEDKFAQRTEGRAEKKEALEEPKVEAGARVAWTGRNGERLTGTVENIDLYSGGKTASVNVDQVATAGRVPIGRIEHPNLDSLEVIEPAEAKAPVEKTVEAAEPANLSDRLYDKISAGEMPKDNNALRKLVEEFDGKPVDNARLKEAQEDLELAIVRRARDIVQNGVGDETIFDKLVELYKSQPNLNIRTSTSVENQAYSTPAPIAFLAARLAGLDRTKTGYEPTAGNGMLTITGDPGKVIANELNDYRANNLKTLGLKVKQGDALKADVKPNSVDSVIANPPFGPLKENGSNTKVKVDGYSIGQIDHLIAARALEAMKDDGKATLILGANKMQPGRFSNDDTIFFNWLYSHYNVTGQFEIDGDLYGRQGAAWPIRVIAVNGRVQSDRFSPREGSIQRVDNWKDVYEQYRKSLEAQQQPARSERAAGALQRTPADNEPRAVRESAPQSPRALNQPEPEGSAAPALDRGGEQPRPTGSVKPEPAANGGRDYGQRPNENLPRPDQLEGGRVPRGATEGAPKPASDNRSPSLASADNQFQVGYTPASGKKDPGVLIPTNMRTPLEQAMRALEDAVGDLDEFVQKELGYSSTEDLHDAFMGLQVDSIAAAVHQMKQGKAVVIADQTGIGKGRQAAGIIRWAVKNGDIPVFVTAKPSLFTDMYNDLHDIGSDNVKPFIVNSDEWIKSADGKRLFANKPSSHRQHLELASLGKLPEDRNALFLTYSQINQPNLQQRVLAGLAHRAVFILDESHNAGGESNTGEFLRAVLTQAKGVTYLSATYAKRPDNMPLYFKTDMGQAIEDSEALIQAMNEGGLPLQTVVSTGLVKAGQMFRRERSYDGVQMLTKVDTARRQEHTKIADGATEALRAIVAADKAFHENYVKERQKEAKAEAKRIKGGGNQASRQVGHTEFTAVVHNFVRQMLLGIKADSAADEAIEALRRGEKPLIAVDNTMGSFLNAYVGDKAMLMGDPLEDFDYRTVLGRALERTRALLMTERNGDQTRMSVSLDELDPQTRKAYDEAQGIIDKLNINLPVSPIDWIRQRLTDAGYSVAEITGRNLAVDYSDPDNPKLGQVPLQEQSDKVETTRRFNDGRLDALLLNVSGSTGISLHASEKFRDQRPRHMVVAQPAQDINIFMQMLGRIHRTGQVKLPKYTILNVDLPAEKRPSALLAKKMKSLNANTSSNTESATSVRAVDMLNKYGDAIIGQYLDDNPRLEAMLGVEATNEKGEAIPDIARKATGRLALLPVRQQEEFYREVEGRYNDFIAYLDSTNQNELEPKTFDYDAQELKSLVLTQGNNPNSPFGADSVYGEYSIKMQGKPLTAAEVNENINHNLGGKPAGDHAMDLISSLDRQYAAFERAIDPEHSGTLQRAQEVAADTRSFIQNHTIGSTWRVEINGDVYSAAVTNLRSTHKGGGNPYSLSTINVTLAVNGPMRMISVPATQMRGIEVTALWDSPEDLFRLQRPDMRETAKIITGNLLAAYGELQGTRGSIINFTKADGTTEQGILLPKKFSVKEHVRGDYRLRDAEHAVKFLRTSKNADIEKIGIASRDQNVRVIREKGRLVIQTPKSKARGGQYFLDRKLTDLTGDFVSQGSVMRAEIPKGKETQALDYLMKKSALYALPSMGEEAKSMAPKKEEPNAGQRNNAQVPQAPASLGQPERADRNQPAPGQGNSTELRAQGGSGHPAAEAQGSRAEGSGSPQAQDPRPLNPEPVKIDHHNTGSTLEQKTEAYVARNGDKMVRDYFAKYTGKDGAINISTDAAKRMFPENVKDPIGTDDDVRGAAFALHQAVWKTALKRPVIPGKEGVLIVTGSPGSGKTTVTEAPLSRYDIKREMLLTDQKEAEEAIQQAIDSGRKPVVTAIFVTDPKETVRRMIKRAVGTPEMPGIGRTVKVDYMGRSYVQIPKVIAALKAKFGDQLEVNTIDNSGDPWAAKSYNGIDTIVQNASKWTVESAREAMHEELDRLRQAGEVPDATYNAANEPELEGDSGKRQPGDRGLPPSAPSEQKRRVLEPGESDSNGTILSANPVFDPRNWKRFNAAYDDAVQKFIDRGLKIGDKYYQVKDVDPTLADNLHLLDNAPRYTRDKAQANLATVVRGLSEEQIRLASLMVDSDSRDYLRDQKPDEYKRATNDKDVMAAVDRFKPLQEELTNDRQALGWPVRLSLAVEEDQSAAPGSSDRWQVLDRDGAVVATAKSQAQAQAYVEQNAKVEPHLKRTYPEHLRQPLPFEQQAAGKQAPYAGSYYNQPGVRPPKMDKKVRVASAQYHYEHGAKDFSGYIDSYRQVKESMLKQSIYDDFTHSATKWTNGTAQPPEIDFDGKTYYRPDVARKMRDSGKKNVDEYAVYDPTRGERFLVKNFEEGWAVLSTGKPGISAQERWLAPKVAVDALEKYDASRGGQATSIRRFFQEQIVGMFGPMVHINNTLRRLGQVTGVGTFDPRSWPSLMRALGSGALRERMQRGVNDDTIDLLTRRGAYTDWHDIGNLHAYWGGNLNPFNWIRSFGKGILFDPKFAGGWGGLDPKIRVLIADYLRDHVTNIGDQEIADTVNDAMGNYNRANWTERQKKLAYFTLFPGWDTASAKWFLRHPIITAIVPAVAVMLANLAMNALGKNKDQDKYDFSYLHYGDRKYRTGLVTDTMAMHLGQPVLEAGKTAIEGGDAREVAGAVGQGVMDAGTGLFGYLRPDLAGAIELATNREVAGRSKEIFNPGDEYLPGKVLPNRKLDKLGLHALVRSFPAARRFLATDQNFDAATGIGSVIGVTNYPYGAEQRLKENEAKSRGYSETLDRLAATDPKAAEAMTQDTNKVPYLMFHGDLSTMAKDLKEIDTEMARVKGSTQLDGRDREQAVKSLETARAQLLRSADALNDALFSAKAKRGEEEQTSAARSLLNRLRGVSTQQSVQ